uniref:Uncharacterized protein n=1 Tax=viral metagenome TaxID=1070528 RepID=A0A6M3LFA9_9ZZZZ
MAKMILTIEVVEITRKGEHLGYKVYINDFVQAAKLPRKPGDLRDPHPEELVFFTEEHGVYQNKRTKQIQQSGEAPVDYYIRPLVDSIHQALIDWQIWKEQGYKRAE